MSKTTCTFCLHFLLMRTEKRAGKIMGKTSVRHNDNEETCFHLCLCKCCCSSEDERDGDESLQTYSRFQVRSVTSTVSFNLSFLYSAFHNTLYFKAALLKTMIKVYNNLCILIYSCLIMPFIRLELDENIVIFYDKYKQSSSLDLVYTVVYIAFCE